MLTRKEFRAYFDADPSDSGATFDRAGFADVSCPWPSPADAKRLAGYSKVKKLGLGIHDSTKLTSEALSRSLSTLLTAWAPTLEWIVIQDYRWDIPKAKLCRAVSDCHSGFGRLEALKFLDLDNLHLSKEFVASVSRLPNLVNVSFKAIDMTAAAFKELERSTSLKDADVAATGLKSGDEKLLSPAFRKRCRIVVYPHKFEA
jgi:hypothetical protein